MQSSSITARFTQASDCVKCTDVNLDKLSYRLP